VACKVTYSPPPGRRGRGGGEKYGHILFIFTFWKISATFWKISATFWKISREFLKNLNAFFEKLIEIFRSPVFGLSLDGIFRESQV